jgi:hypothetical protein
MLLWLENPAIFAAWLALRKKAAGARGETGGGG